MWRASPSGNLVAMLFLLIFWAHTQAIYHPGIAPPPKIKNKVDFKPEDGDLWASTTSGPPIRVYSRGRTRGRHVPPPASASGGVVVDPSGRGGAAVRHAHTPARYTPEGRAQGLPRALTCPQPNGLFPYEQDCSKFINCAEGRPYLQSCGPGTLFNSETNICDWPHAVTCPTVPSHATHGDTSRARRPPPPGRGRGRNKNPSITSALEDVSDTARSAVDSVVDLVNDMVEDKINIIKERVHWTYERAKDKGKRILKKLGVKDAAILCLRPDGIFPYPKDCSKFVNCWRSRPSLQRCAPGTLFNSAKGYCDFPAKAICPSSRAPPSGPSVTHVVPPPSGQRVRLRGGDVPWAGYVQVSGAGVKWGLVTDTLGQWTREDASVVCRSLGFTRGAESAFQGRAYGLMPVQSAVLRQVECEGSEEHLLQCQLHLGSQEDVDKTVVGVRCQRNWVSECREDGVRWGNKCYYMVSSSLVSHAQARDRCSSRSARLLSITSQAENDFVSEMLTSMAGDSVGFHTGGVKTQVFDDIFWLWQNTSYPPTTALSFTHWWPGWNVTSSRGQSDGNGGSVRDEGMVTGEGATTTQCVVIKDNFPVLQNSEGGNARTSAPADYYFWQLSDCEQQLHFVCETDKEDVGCITDRGVTYSGSANITTRGEPCLPWNHPRVQSKVKDFSLTHDLVNNYCANPDGDDTPWCFTSKGSAEFCDIPRCERQETHMEVVESKCPPDKFACTSGGCILLEWQCDGRTDCEDGSDEYGCHDYSQEFSKRLNHQLQGNEVEKWLYTLKTTCAARCVQAKNFVCMSFNYQQSSETCLLSKSNVGLAGGLVTSWGWEYYELKSLMINCSDKFVCRDGKCLNTTQQCDGRRDCKDGEDEFECRDKVNFQVRLVNGSDTHEGRVEVRAFGRWGPVCDDMWSVPEGDVVCQQLGFSLGSKEVFPSSQFGSGSGQYIMDDLNCDGNEASLADCDFAGWGEHDCQPSEAAGVRCFRDGEECERDQWRCSNGRCVGFGYLCDTVDDCHDGSDEERDMCQAPLEVRLVGEELDEAEEERRASVGRVEVRYLGLWGTVCDDDFGIEEGHVLCRMMGWTGASRVYKNNTFGPGTGLVWLDDLRCIGYEASVKDCQHQPWGHTNCDHTEDVGLHCTNVETSASHDEIDARLEETTPLPMLPLTCGQRTVEDAPAAPMERPKIVSGVTPQPGAHPWMVAINLQTKSGPTQWCGGAVLGEEYVLTAAHCVKKYPPSTYLLRVGDFNTQEDEEEQQDFRVLSLAIHSKFDKGPFLNNDIAIIKIKKKNGKGIQFGKFVQPVCLVPQGWGYPPYINCTVAGWGSLGATLGFSKVLQSTLLPILPEETCQAEHVYGPTRLTKGMYCAGYLEGGIDTCQGDSGGPMVCLVNGRHTVVGITSWGHGCARPNKPGVYTKLTHYLHWLKSNLG